MNLIESIKNLLKHSSVYGLATFLQRFIGLLMLPFLTDPAYIASKSEFANFTLYYAFFAFMNILFLYGMDAAFMRFSILSKKNIKVVFTSSFLTLLGTGLLFSFITFLFREPLGELIFLEMGMGNYIILAAVLLFTDSLCNFSYLILRSAERSASFSLLKIIRFSLELVLNILFVIVLKVGWVGMVYGNLIASALNLLLLLWINRKYFIAAYDFSLIKEMIFFGLPFIPNSLGYLLIELIDRFIVVNMLSKEVLAVYSANYRFGMVMGALIFAFRNAWQPFFLKLSKQADARDLFGRILLIFLMFTGVWLVGTALIVPVLVKWKFFEGMSFIHESYWAGTFIIPILLSSYFFYGIYVFFTLGAYIEKKNKWIGLITISGAVVNIAVNLIFLPSLGMLAAALATLAAYFFMALTMFIYNQKIYPIQIATLKVVKVLLILTLYISLIYILNLSLIERILLLLLLPPVFYVTGIVNRDSLKYGKQLLGKGYDEK